MGRAVFFFKQKTAYEREYGLVGSERFIKNRRELRAQRVTTLLRIAKRPRAQRVNKCVRVIAVVRVWY